MDFRPAKKDGTKAKGPDSSRTVKDRVKDHGEKGKGKTCTSKNDSLSSVSGSVVKTFLEKGYYDGSKNRVEDTPKMYKAEVFKTDGSVKKRVKKRSTDRKGKTEEQQSEPGWHQQSRQELPRIKRVSEKPGQLYRCPEISAEDAFPKSVWHDRFRQYVDLIRESDEILATIIQIKSLNTAEASEDCLKILETYLRNLILHPDDEKYRLIRFENKALQEKVLKLEGGAEFLDAVGFTMVNDGEENKAHFAYPYVVREAEIVEVIDLLHRAEGFKLIAEGEGKAKSKERGRSAQREPKTTRTKTFKDKKPRKVASSKYTKIKIRLPDGNHFENTFAIDDKLSSVKRFIEDRLENSKEYKLLKPPAEPFAQEDYERSLEQLELFPAVLLNLKWEAGQTQKEKQDKLNRSSETTKKRIKPKT